MSSNSFTWVTEGGDLGTADWGCLAAAAPACVCRLNTVAVRQAALVSDESALEACHAIDYALYKFTLYLLTLLTLPFRSLSSSCSRPIQYRLPASMRLMWVTVVRDLI